MKKKLGIVLTLITALLLAACSGNGGNHSKNSGDAKGATVELDLSNVWSPGHHVEEYIQSFIEQVDKATDGEVMITSYPGSTLAASDDQVDAVMTGAVDLAVSVHSYTPNEFPLSSVMELPQMAENAHEGSSILYDLMEEFDEFDEEYDGMVPLWVFTSDPGQIFTTDKPVKSVEDLKGMKIRSPSAMTNKWLEALGATPVSMPMDESFEALERGVVDGTIAPWEAVDAWSLGEVVNYATVGNFYLTTFYAVMNEDVWNDLGEETQEQLQTILDKELSLKAGDSYDTVGNAAQEAAEENGMEIYELDEKELEEWATYINPTIEDWIEDMNDRGLPGQEIYDRAKALQAEQK